MRRLTVIVPAILLVATFALIAWNEPLRNAAIEYRERQGMTAREYHDATEPPALDCESGQPDFMADPFGTGQR